MIEVKNLTKNYGNHTAVSNLTFTVENNCVYGFLGPNGAGKSTTMNIITGCLSASDGTVIIDGYDIYDDAIEAKKRIGYLPEIPPLYFDMTPVEYLGFVADAKKVAKKEKQVQIDAAMARTGIEAVSNKRIKSLSKGYKQRVGIAQALIGNPSVIILDEPTVGLDPKQIIEIRDLIKELGKDHTVILSSHILSEVQAVCDKILIIAHGKLIACDTPERLETLFAGSKTITMTVKANEQEARAAIAEIEEIQSIEVLKSEENLTKLEIVTDKEADIAEKLFFAFAGIKKAIIRLSEETASLEDIFLELTAANETAQSDDAVVNEKASDEVTPETADVADKAEGGTEDESNL